MVFRTPFLITSSCDEDDSISIMTTNNDRDETSSTASDPTYIPSPTSLGGGTIINLVNPNKRQRLTSESSVTDEDTKRQPRESRKPAKRSRSTSTTTIAKPASAVAAATTVSFPSSATLGSFGVSIANQNDRRNSTRPAFEELSMELCKIVDAVHYSRHEAVTALTNLCQWGYTDDPIFLEELLELGGIQRILLYLENNRGDPVCVAMAAKAIMTCTVRSPQHQSFNNAKDIVRALTKRNGIEILLRASTEYGGENMHSQVEALRWIWSALLNITDKASAYEVGTLEEQKERILAVFKTGLDTMAKLGGNTIAATTNKAHKVDVAPTVDANGTDDTEQKSVHSSSDPFLSYDAYAYACGGADYQLKTVQWIFSSLCGAVGSRKRTALETSMNVNRLRHGRKRRIVRPVQTAKATTVKAATAATVPTSKVEAFSENSNIILASQVMGLVFITWSNINNNNVLVREDFQELNIFGSCIESLKRPGGLEWIGNKDLLIQASRFFVQCCENKILSTKEDFELVLPLIVDCIANFPESSYQGGLFSFVKKAQSVVDGSMMQESGVLRAIATSLESKDMDNDIKNASRQLLRDIVKDDE
mmetsp:Transcript_264/g.668  ORF Transcript_264/g.668 Transcript_264/m.668 type:complete len:593 (+) Transcript_264:252-2030(+)